MLERKIVVAYAPYSIDCNAIFYLIELVNMLFSPFKIKNSWGLYVLCPPLLVYFIVHSVSFGKLCRNVYMILFNVAFSVCFW